jgi:hypothetical protein
MRSADPAFVSISWSALIAAEASVTGRRASMISGPSPMLRIAE